MAFEMFPGMGGAKKKKDGEKESFVPKAVLEEAQAEWLDAIFNNRDFSDTIFVVGPTQKEFFAYRGFLMNASPVVKAQLSGKFQDGLDDEPVPFPEMDADAFECILRAAYGMDPKISAEQVLTVRNAAQMLMVEPIVKACQVALLQQVKARNVVEVYSAAHLMDNVTEELERRCMFLVFQSSEEVVDSEAWLRAHPAVLRKILKAPFFDCPEEKLWTRLVAWAEANVRSEDEKAKKALLAKGVSVVGLNAPDPADEQKAGGGDGDEKAEPEEEKKCDVAMRDRVLEKLAPIIPMIRFPAMTPEFFIDQADGYLPPEVSKEVLIHYLTKRPTRFEVFPRGGDAGGVISHEHITIHWTSHDMGKAERLFNPEVDAEWSRSNELPQYLVFEVPQPLKIKKLRYKNHYNDNDTVENFSLYYIPIEDGEEQKTTPANGDWQTLDWQRFQELHSEKTNDWQEFSITMPHPARLFRIQLVSTYGGYTCIDHMQLDTSGSVAKDIISVKAASHALDKANQLFSPSTQAEWSRSSDMPQWVVFQTRDPIFMKRIKLRNHYSDNDTCQQFTISYCSDPDAGGNYGALNWTLAGTFTSQKVSTWQSFNVSVTQPSTLFKLEVLSTYGGYLCIDHLEVHVDESILKMEDYLAELRAERMGLTAGGGDQEVKSDDA